MIRTLAAGALLLGTCSAPHSDGGTKAPCTTDVTVVQVNGETDCDLTPPQTLVIQLADHSDYSMHLCDDAGGQVLLTRHEVFCINADY